MLVNGEQTNLVSAADRGFQYGDALFETLAVVHGAPCLWRRHMQRLIEGCSRLNIPQPDAELLLEEARQEIGEHDRGVLKIIVTRGEGGRGYCPPTDATPNRLIYFSPWPDYPADAQKNGVAARICDMRLACNPTLAGIKHLNRLEQVLARAEWRDPAISEGIMLDTDGRVIEGTMSNLFLVTQGSLVTPDLSRCGTAGVMRGLIMELAAALNISCSEGTVTVEDMAQADILFFSNSLMGIWPVRSLGERSYVLEALPADLIQAVMEQGFQP